MTALSQSWRQQLHDYAQREEYRYEVNGDQILFRFATDGDGSQALAVDATESFLVFRMADDRYLADSRLALAVAAVNEFNREHFMPKAFVHQYDDGQLDIRGEACTFTSFDLSQKEFDELMNTMLASMAMLYRWLSENYSL